MLELLTERWATSPEHLLVAVVLELLLATRDGEEEARRAPPETGKKRLRAAHRR